MSLPHDTLTQEYIEIIAFLEKEHRVARVKDIADRRGVSRSNVSIALTQLTKKELISHESYGHVILTPAGRRLAQKLDVRHQAVKTLLISVLGLSEQIAEQDACKFEHLISAETLTALTRFLYLLENCPKDFSQNLKNMHKCMTEKQDLVRCKECQVL
jgi:DtxR family transcriptional regulator, Mn-dependent transcriptional regulator